MAKRIRRGPRHTPEKKKNVNKPAPQIEEKSPKNTTIKKHQSKNRLGLSLILLGITVVVILILRNHKEDTRHKIKQISATQKEKPENPIELEKYIANNFIFECPDYLRERMKADMLKALQSLKKYDIPIIKNTPNQKTLISANTDPSMTDNGVTIVNNQLRIVNTNRQQGILTIADPIVIDKIVINYNDESTHQDVTMAHELIHNSTGVILDTVWKEGITEAMETMFLENKLGKEKAWEDIHLKETKMIKNLQLHNYAWYNMGFAGEYYLQGSTLSAKTFLRFTSGLVWYEYLQKNPKFLSKFIKKVRLEVEGPNNLQIKLHDRQGLIRIAKSIDPNFEDWYKAQKPFQKPKAGEIITSKFLEKGEMDIFCGIWQKTSIQIGDTHYKFLDIKPISPIIINYKIKTPDGITIVPQKINLPPSCLGHIGNLPPNLQDVEITYPYYKK